MTPPALRLRLTIRRHAVPETKLVWPCIASEDLTVSKLLAQVNEVVPLESGDWGLEDYAVELTDREGASFECLHFQQVGQILKEDDQILIRSLMTEDLKRRRLSGRHQITLDGKHLIDGLSFGRPWLRTPRDRPALDLPPRKRARVTYDPEVDGDDESIPEEDQAEPLLLEAPPSATRSDGPGQVGLRVMFDDADLDADDEDDDLDFEDDECRPERQADDDAAGGTTDEEVEEDLEEELRNLQKDNSVVGHDPPTERLEFSTDDDEVLKGLLPPLSLDLSSLDHITALRMAFPLTSISTIQTELFRHQKNLRETFQSLSKSNEPTISFDEMMDRALTGVYDFSEQQSLELNPPMLQGIGSQGLEAGTPQQLGRIARPLIQEVETVETTDLGLAVASETEPTTTTLSLGNPASANVHSDSDDTSSSESSDSDSESDSDSADSSSDSDEASSSDDDDEPNNGQLDQSGNRQSKTRPRPDLDLSSGDSDSSDSDSDFGSDSESSPADNSGHVSSDGSDSDSSGDSSDSSDSSDSDSGSEPEELSSTAKGQQKAPGADLNGSGKQQTANPSGTSPASVPPGSGLSKTQKRNARRREAKRLRELQGSQPQPGAGNADSRDSELEARKRALLSVVCDEPNDSSEGTKNGAAAANGEAKLRETPATSASQDESPNDGSQTTSQRRMKVDMGAGRRLLFGALGLKNPKSKSDEDKVRKTLMKDVRPLKNERIKDASQPHAEEPQLEQVDDDPDAWRMKITYRAVECCHQGMVLSEPPFPFVQRWDPQQQYGSMRKRKRQSQEFYDDSYHNDSYYDEDSYWNDDQGEQWNDGTQNKKSKKRKGKKGNKNQEDNEETVVLNYDDVPAKSPSEGENKTDMDDDLPPLPSNLSTLTPLERSDASPGMVITWKQLLLSKSTNWQPQVSSLTGLVLSLSEDDTLHVLLAKRDRQQDEKVYDDYTGKRVYDRFEAPDSDDEAEADDGRRDLTWGEIMEPRIVHQSQTNGVSATPADQNESHLGEEGAPPSDSDLDKVRQNHDNCKNTAEELDTQELTAQKDSGACKVGQDTQTTDTSTSNLIPSGQGPMEFEPTASADHALLHEHIPSATTSNDELNNLSPLPQATTHEAVTHEVAESMQITSDESTDNVLLAQGGSDEAPMASDFWDLPHSPSSNDKQHADPVICDSLEFEAIIPDSMAPNDSVIQIPTEETGNGIGSPAGSNMVAETSPDSIRSGRQPLSKPEHEQSEEQVGDSIMTEAAANVHEATVSKNAVPEDAAHRSSSPFPTLEEIFHTAATSRQTESPARVAQLSALRSLKPRVRRDLEYEEMMRKLDEGDETDHSNDKKKPNRNLFKDVTKAATTDASVEAEEPPKLNTEKLHKSMQVQKGSGFLIPEGSQVIELLSSPLSQDDANHQSKKDNESDQGSPTPKARGRGLKAEADAVEPPRRETRSRTKSMPASEVKNSTARSLSAKGRTSLRSPADAKASAFSQIKGRLKYIRKA